MRSAALHIVAVVGTLVLASIECAPQERSDEEDELSNGAGATAALQSTFREAYFDGSAQLRLGSFVSVHRHSGLSFRTCEPGRLFEQRINPDDSISLRVDHDGLLFTANLQQRRLEARLNARLLDNAWHNVNLFFRLGNLTLSAAGHAQVVANATYNSEILALPEQSVNGTLIVGQGFRGCILEGPSILFNDTVSSNAIFGACPLDTRPCGSSGGAMSQAPGQIGPTVDWCINSPCKNRGKCVSKHDRYECHCNPRYSGTNCQIDHGSPCLRSPCSHGGTCIDDGHGDFVCSCQPGWVGPRCDSVAGSHVCDGPLGPCQNGATCFPVGPDGNYRCECPPGFDGRHCETDIDECTSNPCHNHGNCTDAVNGYTCRCDRTGYKGQSCEVDIDECVEIKPCLNGGNCYNNYGGYVCACPEGFEGQNCELNINECQSSPCLHGATCLDEVGSYRCNCTGTGYSGHHCEHPLRGLSCDNAACPPNSVCLRDGLGLQCACKPGYLGVPPNCLPNHCASGPCEHGATCTNLKDRFECTCPPEYKGPMCGTPLSAWCPSCYNGGSCVEGPRGHVYCQCPRFWTGPQCKEPVTCTTHRPCKFATECRDYPVGYFCVCEPGWTGPECSVDVDECMSDPCRNGGVCIDQLNSYYCQCLSGFAGKNCQINVDECSSSPCLHGGTCVDRANGYTCNCTPEYMGDNCEREFDACARRPCGNNGTCTLTSSSKHDFVCQCPLGFEGKVCEIDVDECVGVVCDGDKICVDGVAGYECRCRDGYREPNCTLIVDPCLDQPCVNGTCRETSNEQFTCDCAPGFTGTYCSDDIDECKTSGASLCVNGICLNNRGSYECFCRPGFSGNHCEFDINECLCGPCQNNATCIDKVNTYQCECPLGYTGKTCDKDVNECEDNPCMHGATCIDEIAQYTCICPAGFTGYNCETNIDDCATQPCQNAGLCIDGVNSYSCNCTDTGFDGDHCEINIDDCLEKPCQNGAECVDQVKDYKCLCYEGYTGKNCEADVNECESSPCQYNGTCLERSNINLYKEDVKNKPAVFMHEFSYANASGYECICVHGVTGKNCEININECESNPCYEGACKDNIGGYTCECEGGFEGTHCEIEIDECERQKPCQNNATCEDKRNDYFCRCDPKYGGKNCSVELTGCNVDPCMNGGKCVPYVVNETEHKFNCACPNGFHGDICDHVTTMSMSGNSLVTVNTTREEGYDISFRFRTTLPNGLLAMGQDPTYYMLEMIGGKLNLHSSLLNKWNGVFIGSGLNDSNWQKVFVAINSSHLILSANEEQTIYPINLNEGNNASYTSFSTTYIGGTVKFLSKLPHGPAYFIGCTEDVIINGESIYSGISSKHVEMQNVESGCPREAQCVPNPCKNNGHCTDRWRDFSCKCERPYLGATCQYNMTAATFGYENITNGYVTVKVSDAARKTVRSIIDISMFIRTREDRGDIFYLGQETSGSSPDNKEKTYIAASLEGGELLVRIQFNGTEAYTVGGVKLNDGNHHLIQVIRNITLVQVKINGTEYFRKTISAIGQLNVTILYLGGLPQVSRYTRQVDSKLMEVTHLPQTNFKGVIQDVQVSNGVETMFVEFFPLKAKGIPALVQFGNVTFDHDKILEGIVSDNVCASSPCFHNGTCHVTWNDFWCQCPRGYTGKTCQDMEFCQLQDCPTGSKCQNLDGGYECVANATFDGVNTSFTYTYNHPEETNLTESKIDTIMISYRSNTGGTLMHMAPSSGNSYFTVSVFEDKVTVAWKLDLENNGILTFGKPMPDGNWTKFLIKLYNNSIECVYVEDTNEDTVPQSSQNFSFDSWYDLLLMGSVTLGGLGGPLSERHSYLTVGMERHIESRDGIPSNSVDFAERKLTTAPPPHSMLSGEAFKGCLGEVRIGSMLLHYFTYEEVYQNANFTPLEFLSLQQDNASSHDNIGCRLCFESQCKNNGYCSDQFNSYICDCPPGYAMDDCSVDIDECEGNKCENNSTCLDGIANYTCVCKTGWQGWLCEEDVNECVSYSPCQHDGVCVNLPGSFSCECPDQYTGDLCEHFKLITCADEPCRNGSTCADIKNLVTGDNFTCTCMPGYEGTICDTPYCVNRKCKNDGKCDFLNQPPRCVCPEGFTGPYCETNIDDCAPDIDGNVPCKNEGKCHDGVNSYSCDCSGTGYTGPDCSQDIDECLDSLTDCGSGKCENLPGSYRCICDEGYCGYNCKMINPCIDGYCKNGGTCECVEDKGYMCQCPPEYTGQNCTESEHFLGSQALDIAVIVGPIIAVLLLIAAGSLIALFMMARKKRATRGTYSPSAQEFSNPRVEMDNVMKPPPEERLI